MAILISILGILFVFSLIIIAHEFGHFILAKKSGVRVDEFAVGFPPKLWSKKKGETRYSINLIPLGGFVKIFGSDGQDEKDPKSFSSKPAYIRLLILLAGVFLNFTLAWIIIFLLFVVGMQPILPDMANHKHLQNNMKTVITVVEKDTPAEKEGIRPGDIITSVDGKEVKDSRFATMYIDDLAGKNQNNIKIDIQRDGQVLHKNLSTYLSKIKVDNQEIEKRRIGVVLETQGKVKASPFVAVAVSFQEVIKMIGLTFIGVYDLFVRLISKFQLTEGVAGPVGIFKYTGTFAQMGFSPLVQFAAILSIAVGVFNVIPIPGLDGGHTLIILIETAIRRKFSIKTKNIVQFAGFGVLIAFTLLITLRDLKII